MQKWRKDLIQTDGLETFHQISIELNANNSTDYCLIDFNYPNVRLSASSSKFNYDSEP